MKNSFIILFLFFSFSLTAQDISINNGWKFKTGDSTAWASPKFNDNDWAPINVGQPWETQGYDKYDGFAWYRLHVVIPSSIKTKAIIKEKIRFDLGKIDDGDEVYLNGSLIGINAGANKDIKQGNWLLPRSYIIPLSSPHILWDKENVIAVRVWDGGGNGGMYDGTYNISVVDITSSVIINTSDNSFQFGNNKQVSKKIILQSISDKYDFKGRLNIVITDPFSNAVVSRQSTAAAFTKDKPFSYIYYANLPENRSYTATYTFDEEKYKKQIRASEGIPYLLTPKVLASPKINGTTVYGVRPNAPFLYKIPATGEEPLSYEVTGLPDGLQLDKKTGIISGTIAAKGVYKIKLIAKNKLGLAYKDFTIVCGNTIGLTPAMGWNSWNCWGLSVSDEKVKASAKQLADKLAAHGWAYVNIDDGWEDKRNDSGEIIPNNKFPDMKGLSDHVHGLGLKLGIYSSPGPLTCGGYVASYQHEEQDAKTYNEWGIDYLKYDWCSYDKIAPIKPSLDDYKKPYTVMRDALDKVNRDIVFSFCQYGMGDVWKWGTAIGGNSWRTTGDINDSWGSMSGIGFSQDSAAAYTQPGHFNDPDMLVVGKVGWGPSLHNTRLTPDEQYTHISLWCLLSSPLLIGCDMSQMDDFTMNLLTNDEVLAIDQDALGKSARKVFEKDKILVWVKELEDGNKAIGIFNLDDKATKATINFADLKLPSSVVLRDLWRQKTLGSFTGIYTTAIAAHGVVLVKGYNFAGK